MRYRVGVCQSGYFIVAKGISKEPLSPRSAARGGGIDRGRAYRFRRLEELSRTKIS